MHSIALVPIQNVSRFPYEYQLVSTSDSIQMINKMPGGWQLRYLARRGAENFLCGRTSRGFVHTGDIKKQSKHKPPHEYGLHSSLPKPSVR